MVTMTGATASPRIQKTVYRGTPYTAREMFRVAFGEGGEKNFLVRRWAEGVIRGVRPRDYWSEALAIYYAVCGPRFRYTRDPMRQELVKAPVVLLEEIGTRGVAMGDCDDLATFLTAAVSVIGGRVRIATVSFTPAGEGKPDPRLFADPVFRLVSSPHPRLPGPFTHVFVQAERTPGRWTTLDPVAGPRTGQMHARVKQVRFYLDRGVER